MNLHMNITGGVVRGTSAGGPAVIRRGAARVESIMLRLTYVLAFAATCILLSTKRDGGSRFRRIKTS